MPLATWRLLLCLTVLGGLTVAGCQDESLPSSDYQVDVLVKDILDDSPTEGIELILMDPDRNLPLSDPVLSDASGSARFTGLDSGRFEVLAYPRAGNGIDHQPGPFSLPPEGSPAAGPGQPGPTAPKTSPIPAYPVMIRTFRSPAFEEELPRISGEVVDADTGLPLARAFLGLPSHVTAYQGALGVDDDVSDAAGRFTVSGIPFTIDPETENIFQVLPLVVSREGYAPVAWFHRSGNGDNNLDITGARIELHPVTAVGVGRLSGRVLLQGEPAADVPVALAAARSSPDFKTTGAGMGIGSGLGQEKQYKSDDPIDPDDIHPVEPLSGVGQPGLVVTTDAHGNFSFSEVPVGGYLVHPGYRSDDAFVLYQRGGSRLFFVTADAVTRTDNFTVVHAIFPLSPLPGQALTDSVRVLSWSGVEAAARYRIYVDRRNVGMVTEPEIQLRPGQYIGPGRHSWSVLADDAAGENVGRMEQEYRFTVLDR